VTLVGLLYPPTERSETGG